MEKQIFKEGDRVFIYGLGWVVIEKATEHYAVVCKTYEGKDRYFPVPNYLLSFTEYTLQNFSQERPINYEDYVGKWGRFWDKKELFVVSKLAKFDKYSDCPFTIIAEEHFKHFEPLTEEQIKILGLE